MADLPVDDLAPSSPLHGTRHRPRRHLSRPGIRRDLHDHIRGPGQQTTNIPYYLYETAFRAFDIGRASAMGVVVVVATIIIATLALRTISGLFSDEGMKGRL